MSIKIHPSFILYLLCIGILSSFEASLCMLIALLIHESGHLLVSRIIGEQITQIELTPFGGMMTRAYGSVCHKGIRGICLHAAGPLLNYAALLLSGIPLLQQMMGRAFSHGFVTANASMLLINMLPVLPLDGGNIAFCIGYYFFPVARLVSILSTLGVAVGLGLAAFSVCGYVLFKTLNCSLMIVGIHVICCAGRGRHTLLAENLCTVIQERMTALPGIRAICSYQVACNTQLFSLIPFMQKNCALRFAFCHEQSEYILNEEQFCRFLLQDPSKTIAEAFFSHIGNEEKSPENCFTS